MNSQDGKANKAGKQPKSQDKNGLLTVKQYAEAAGVTQQAVYKRLNKGLSKFVVEVDGQKYIQYQALTELEQGERAKPIEQTDEQLFNNVDKLIETLSRTVDVLQKQLEAKDKQIEDLNNRLEQALNNTAQSHYITAQVQNKALQGPEPKDERKSGFLSRLFKR